MDPIKIQALITPSEIRGQYLAHTSYGILGQGEGSDGAKESAQSVIVTYLGAYADQDQPFPSPPTDVSTRIPSGRTMIEDGVIEREPEQGLPKLVFEFFRLK